MKSDPYNAADSASSSTNGPAGPVIGDIVARAESLLADAAATVGVHVTPVYRVTGPDGRRAYFSSFDEAAETACRVAAGGRAA